MSPISRRYFMFGTLLTGALPRPTIASLKALGYQSPNEKLNVAGIGAGGQPFGDLRACEPENIVALADVDWKRGEQGFKRWEKAAKYKDFRQMLDKEHKNMDAVVIGTPDHNGDAYLPPGMTVEQARKVPGAGPQVGPVGGGFGGGGRPGAAPGAAGALGGGPPAGGPPRPQGIGYNSIFAGSKGYLGTSGRGEGVGLLPGSRWAEYKLPAEYLPRSPGASAGSNHAAHLRDWIRACKGGAPACSNFSIAGPYTEWLVLGAIAVRVEGKLLWDNVKGEITNNKEANKLVKPLYRKGWEIKL